MGAKKVKFQNINKIFLTEDERRVHAVVDLDLDIESGEFVCLLGPSGCGKTTILRMLAGFEIPTEGHIYIGDENVEKITPDKRDTAMVFQNYALFPHMNVYDNIAYGLKLQKLPKKEIDKKVHKVLSLMNMEEFSKRVPSQMSGGQQQRVSLARALVMEPGVLLFDEPLSNLDAKLRIHMRDEIRKIQQQVGITSIYVTHDQAEAMGLADKVIIMKDGYVEQVGSPKEIYQNPVNEFVANFIGKANIFRGKLVEKLDDKSIVDIKGVKYEILQTTDHEIGEEVDLVVRPEGIIVSQDDFKGRVTKSMFMGAYHEYEILFEGKNIEISMSNPHGKKTYEIGDEMGFSLDSSAIHIL